MRFGRAREFLLLLGLYGTLGVASTWPLAREAEHAFPLGQEHSATVSFASAWALWWTSDRAEHGFQDYWRAPIFHPTEESFAFSEPMPALGLLATPLLWGGLPLCLAYNLVLLLTLALNGVTSERLLRALGLRRMAAFAGGAFVVLLPSVQHELGVLTLVPLFGIVLSMHALYELTRAPKLARGAWLGLALALTYFLCAQYAIFLGWGLLASLPWWSRGLRSKVGVQSLAACALTLGLTAGPVALSQREALARHHFVRSEQRAIDGASKLVQWTRPPWPEVTPFPLARAPNPGRPPLYPGTVRIVLMLVAAVTLWRRPERRGFWGVLGALAAGTLLLSVVPHLRWGALDLFDGLRRLAPGLALIRSLWRAAIVTQLVLTLFAAVGVQALWELAERLDARRQLGLACVALLSLIATIELWPPTQALAEAPSKAAYGPFARWVATHVRADEPLVYLPFPEKGVRSFEDTARFMLLQQLHGRPMVNGYSSFFPAPHERLFNHRLDLSDPTMPALLTSFGVRYVIVRDQKLPRAREQARALGFWLAMVSPELGISAYRIPQAPAQR